jgi:hypothetical protein
MTKTIKAAGVFDSRHAAMQFADKHLEVGLSVTISMLADEADEVASVETGTFTWGTFTWDVVVYSYV